MDRTFYGAALTRASDMRDALIHDVKFNCDVSDAKFWGYFSLCGLLMRFRELFRAERHLPPWAPIDQQEIAAWIALKEGRWPELESAGFRDLTINGERYDPFDVSGINTALKDTGLVYGAGYGVYMKPNFLLAELHSYSEIYDYRIYVIRREYARDLFVSSGMLQGRCIFLRIEPLKAYLWEKFLEFKAKRSPHLSYAFSHYGFSPEQPLNGDFADRFDQMVGGFSAVVLRHELAEAMEDVPDWQDMLVKVGDRDAEFLMRALKDLIADTSGHGPLKKIIDEKNKGALGLFVALVEGYRKSMYPEIRTAFAEFAGSGEWDVIEAARKAGYERFTSLRQGVFKTFETARKERLAQEVKALLAS